MIRADQYHMSRPANKIYTVSLAALLFGTLFFAATILLPFFAMGIYQMPAGQIWASSFDLSWHPFYSGMREALYTRALPVVFIWLFLGAPLLVSFCWELIWYWRSRPLRASLRHLLLLLPPIVAFILFFVYAGKLADWIMD